VRQAAREQALLDNGASKNLIDDEIWKTLGIRTFKRSEPIAIYNIGKMKSKQRKTIRYCWLEVKRRNQEYRMQSFTIRLKENCLILEYPFALTFNPQEDWQKGRILGPKISTGFKLAWGLLQRTQLQAAAATGRWLREGETIYYKKATTSQSIAREWLRKQDKIAPEGLPEEPKEHWKVFNEEMAKQSPSDRIEDMKIPLHPDASKTINCKIYPLNKEEENYVREFLKKQEGYIHPGMSPITSPTFVREKKGEKQIIVDYKEANQHSMQDSDVMVNICTILESLTGKELSSKINTRWGHENIHISKEDQYKAAFKTTFGIYIPRIVYFRSMNTLPYFQRVL